MNQLTDTQTKNSNFTIANFGKAILKTERVFQLSFGRSDRVTDRVTNGVSEGVTYPACLALQLA